MAVISSLNFESVTFSKKNFYIIGIDFLSKGFGSKPLAKFNN